MEQLPGEVACEAATPPPPPVSKRTGRPRAQVVLELEPHHLKYLAKVAMVKGVLKNNEVVIGVFPPRRRGVKVVLLVERVKV